MLVKDGDKAVGFNLVDYVEKEDFGKYFTNGTPMENPVLEIKDDYAEGVFHFLFIIRFIFLKASVFLDIQKGPYKSHLSNQLLGVLEIPVSQTLRFLPPDVNRILFHEAVGLYKEYQK